MHDIDLNVIVVIELSELEKTNHIILQKFIRIQYISDITWRKL